MDHHQECKVVGDHLVDHPMVVVVEVDLVVAVDLVAVGVSVAAEAFVVDEVVVDLADHQTDLEDQAVSADEAEEEDGLHQLT